MSAKPVPVVGIDFGTLSARALVVDSRDGTELGSAVHDYEHGVMDATFAPTGEPLPPDWALQDPRDYVEVLRVAVPRAVAAAGVRPSDVVGIATDFTASTPLPVNADGTPLCCDPRFERRPHAYAKLWKHHAASPEADRINAVAAERGEPWLARYGGKISAEWQYAKALQLLHEAPDLYEAADRWIEAADWIVWQLTGEESRNACTAGYKGIHQDGAYPDEDYLRAVDPGFGDFVSSKLEHQLSPLGSRVATLSGPASEWTGLPKGIAVAAGNVDAHVTAPAARAVDPDHLLAVMGTSTCHVVNSHQLVSVPGMCGVVDGGIVAGCWGYEAGQSSVGDIFGWFADNYVPESYARAARAAGTSMHDYLASLTADRRPGDHGLLALDWHNGNRSILIDHELSGVLIGQTLATRPEDVYRALVEATAFGTRLIVETFEASGVTVEQVTAAGGLSAHPFVMQIYADVLGRPVSTIGTEQGPALGSAIHAAVAAGVHEDVRSASEVMGKVAEAAFRPDPAAARVYDDLYSEYTVLHDYFGRHGNDVLHRLRALRDRAKGRP